MSFFNQIYEKLFSKNKSEILSKEVLSRTDKEVADYEAWSDTDASTDLLNRIKRAYHFKKTNIKDEIIIDILDTPYAKGMAVSKLPEAGKKTYQLLMDHFKNQVLSLGYRQSGSDKRIKNKGELIESTEKYYLKPPIQMEPPINQEYGNILLELLLHNDKPVIMKLQANVYSDSLYSDPKDFEELLDYIFENKEN